MVGQYKNPMNNPLHYATKQLATGPPATYAAAERTLLGYDYGKLTRNAICLCSTDLRSPQK